MDIFEVSSEWSMVNSEVKAGAYDKNDQGMVVGNQKLKTPN